MMRGRRSWWPPSQSDDSLSANLPSISGQFQLPLDTSQKKKKSISTSLPTTCRALTLQGHFDSPGVNYLLVSGSPLHKQGRLAVRDAVPQLEASSRGRPWAPYYSQLELHINCEIRHPVENKDDTRPRCWSSARSGRWSRGRQVHRPHGF